MTVGDARDGDVVLIRGREYRLTIPMRGGYLARPDRTGEPVWMGDEVEIDEIVVANPRRDKKSHRTRSTDPMGGI